MAHSLYTFGDFCLDDEGLTTTFGIIKALFNRNEHEVIIETYRRCVSESLSDLYELLRF